MVFAPVRWRWTASRHYLALYLLRNGTIIAFAKIFFPAMLALQQPGARMGFLDSYAPQIKSILRIVTGLLFFSVGLAKIAHFPNIAMFADARPFVGIEGWAGMIELVGGALVSVGLFSRYAAFICSGEMAVAYFLGHWAIVTSSLAQLLLP